MKKKLNLKMLQVQSFVTDSILMEDLKGGSDPATGTTICLVDCRPCDSEGGCGTGGGDDTQGFNCTVIGFQ